jgi:hypothetical protein
VERLLRVLGEIVLELLALLTSPANELAGVAMLDDVERLADDPLYQALERLVANLADVLRSRSFSNSGALARRRTAPATSCSFANGSRL